MAASYFANAAYGVLLDVEERKNLEKKVLRHTIDPEEMHRRANASSFLEELRKVYDAPEGVQLLYTGDEDMRPGECNVMSNEWILGYGVLAFPFPAGLQRSQDGSSRWQREATWHMWVEVS